MRTRLITCISLLLLWSTAEIRAAKRAFEAPKTLEAAIAMLDEYVENRDSYLEQRMTTIDSLKRELLNVREGGQLDVLQQLGDSYHLVDTDSALYYYGRALQIADARNESERALRLKLNVASLLPVNAIIRESVAMYDSIDPDSLDEGMRRKYFEAGNRLYLYAESFYSVDTRRRKYHRLASAATDSLLGYLDPNSAEYAFYSAQTAHNRGDLALAQAGMRRVMETAPVSSNLYAKAAAELASMISEREGYNLDEQLYYLIMAAIGDIAAGTKETTALQSVGLAMYDKGDFVRAYRYLNQSLEDAIHSGARLRTLQVAETLPIISRAYADVAERSRTRLRWLVGLLGVAAVALALFAVQVLLQRRRMHEFERRLQKSLEAKDDYIGKILSLCSNYIERLEDFNRMAGRKIKAGQVGELYDMIESGKMLQEQTHQFHELFDAAFANVYPDFTDQVNALLQPERRIAATGDGKLTPELRMLAFMKLGITDSPRLARFLGLSLNTVYAYRNKLKNRATDRDNFEQNVAKIGRIVY